MVDGRNKKRDNLLGEERSKNRKQASALDERLTSLENSLDALTQLMGNLSSQINLLNTCIELDLAAGKREEETKKLRRAEMRARGLRFAFLLFLAAMMLSILIIVKPGAKIFYSKQIVDKEKIELYDGQVYRYPLEISERVSPLDGILLEEDDQLLERSSRSRVTRLDKGAYDLGDLGKEDLYVYFSSTAGEDPRINESSYTLYYPVIFFSRQMGTLYLVMLMLGLVFVLFRALRRLENRQKLIPALRSLWAEVTVNMSYWKRLFTFTVLAAFLFTFMEWLFFVTMPSFMDMMSLVDKLVILILTGLAVSILCVSVLLVVIGIDVILTYLKLTRRIVFAGVLVPAGILTILSLLLFDNFTYTVFKFGVVSTFDVWRGVYGLVFIILFAYITFRMLTYTGLREKAIGGWWTSPRLFYLVCVLLLVSIGVAIANYQSPTSSAITVSTGISGKNLHRPNILLLGGDGMNAYNLSLYGYQRDTTPRLLALSKTSLLAENAFPNSCQSTGSVVSIFTSKLPTETRVVYTPDILKGSNAFQHLPGILRGEGYQTVQLGVAQYIDANAVNLQNSFNSINGQSEENGGFPLFVYERGFSNPAYFMRQLSKRIGDRLQHIFYLKQMENPMIAVTEPTSKVSFSADRAKVAQIIDLLTHSSQPVFIQAHLMVTHGPLFSVRQPEFSKGEEQTETWMTDFYDDAILDLDISVGEILDALKEAGVLDNTIVIIYTDHGMKYHINRIPLMFHFPNNEYAGRIQADVQNLDVAPTILDYMGLQIPEWMDGQSLLQKDLRPDRLIFSVADRTDVSKTVAFGLSIIDPERIGPPFYQFGGITITQCQRWYSLDFLTLKWSSGSYAQHTSPCAESNLYSFEQIWQATADLLSRDGFDISTLPH
jgi:glucan phosphoethanolaminetransferase (alkaline phosphatase superfamily)